MPPTRARASESGASSAQASSGPRGFAQHREWLGRVEKFLSEIGIASDSDDDSAAPSTEPSPIPTPSPCSETAQASTGNSTGTTSVAPDSSATTTLAPAPGPQAPTEASAPSGAAGPQAPPAPSAPSMASLSSPQRTAARELLNSMPAELIAASLPTLTLYLLEYLGKRTDRSRTQDLDQLEQLQPDIDQLLAAGEEYNAYLLLCERAFRAVAKYGFSPNVREDSVRAVLDVLDIEYLWGETPVPLYEWVLPRAVELWGVDHAHTRKIVHRAALEVCQLRDPREHVEFARTVTELAQQLPGGLGWGSTVVAPMPDEEAYNRHAMMQYQALVAINKGQYSLAHTMLQRCVTFYESLGQHWLGTVRKVKALSSIALCVKNIEGAQAAEPYAVKCKRTAQKELGTTHEITLGIAWEYGHNLASQKRYEQALSVFAKNFRMCKEAMGARTLRVNHIQMQMVKVLRDVGKLQEAEALCIDAFDTAYKVGGPRAPHTKSALINHCMVLRAQGREEEEQRVKWRGVMLGCHVDW